MEKKTRVVNRRRTKEFDVYVGRPSYLGNPFVVGRDGSRAEVIEKYRRWLDVKIATVPGVREHVASLAGKTLACWCHPLPCHADVIAEKAESLSKEGR